MPPNFGLPQTMGIPWGPGWASPGAFLPQMMYSSHGSNPFIGAPLPPHFPPNMGMPSVMHVPFPFVPPGVSNIPMTQRPNARPPAPAPDDAYMGTSGHPVRSCRLRRPARRPLIDSDMSEESSFSETETSDSDAAPSDSSESDFGTSRRKARRRGYPGRGRPRLGARPPSKSRPVVNESDASDVSKNRRKLARPKTKGEHSEESHRVSEDQSSDSSYASGGVRSRKRRRPSPSPETARRSSARHPAKAQRVNYAALGQNFESDPEEEVMTSEKSAQPEGPAVDRVLGYRGIDTGK